MSMCNVLGVLGDNEDRMWKACEIAVELADAENARLTLVKTCDDGRAYVWITPFAFGGVYTPSALESPAAAAKQLARVADTVPATIPVTTFVLGPETQAALVKLIRSGNFGAVVADADLLAHCRRLKHQLRRDAIRVVSVTLSPAEQDTDGTADPMSSGEPTSAPRPRWRQAVSRRSAIGSAPAR